MLLPILYYINITMNYIIKFNLFILNIRITFFENLSYLAQKLLLKKQQVKIEKDKNITNSKKKNLEHV